MNFDINSLLGILGTATLLIGYFNKAYTVKHQYVELIEEAKKTATDLDSVRDSQEALKVAVKEILKTQLKESHKELTSKESITSEEFEAFKNQYDAYHGVGGNGTGTRWYKDIQTIPIQD